MDTSSHVLWAFTLYKALSLLVGLLVVFMGYKLFIKGIYRDAGELQAEWNQNKLLLKKAAPGTFFSLFGAIIICFAVFKGLNYQQGQTKFDNSTKAPPLESDEYIFDSLQHTPIPDSITLNR